MTTLSITVARFTDGSVDEDGTVDTCRTAIRQFVASRETELTVIGDAVTSVFDTLSGKRAPMPYVTQQVLTALNAQSENYSVLVERIGDYLRSNSGTRESGALFNIGKGKGGGICRWSDQPVETPVSK